MIEITGLWKRFGRFDAIQGLSLGIPGGSAFALIGANRAGKTTMIKTLMNLIQPDRGSAIVMGTDSRQLSAADYAKIGYVSENQELPERLMAGQFLAYLRPFYTRQHDPGSLAAADPAEGVCCFKNPWPTWLPAFVK